MKKSLLIKLCTSIVILSIVAACGTVSDEEPQQDEDPQVKPIEENQPLNLQGDNNKPTENEMNTNFGKEIDKDDVRQDIPDDYLEKDLDTPSSP